MKLSDYIAIRLRQEGIGKVFCVTGGAAAHMIDSVARADGIDYVCAQHEQAAGMEAEAYARFSENIGAVITTSGPGGTNLATSISGAWFDSIPSIWLTGQVARFRLKRDAPIRQRGFQETDILSMLGSVAKYATMVEDPTRIAYELDKAAAIARAGRPGPVLLDMPDDVQREEIEPESLPRFDPSSDPSLAPPPPPSGQQVDELVEMLLKAWRPLLIFGAGIGLAKARQEAQSFARRLGIPVVTSWGGIDTVAESPELRLSSIGVCGPRSGNFAVQKADLLIVVGSRLAHMVTGGKQDLFAPEARKVMIDVDPGEIGKLEEVGIHVDLAINCHLRDFFAAFEPAFEQAAAVDRTGWREECWSLKRRYPPGPTDPELASKEVNPYFFLRELSAAAPEGAHLTVDTGACVCWTGQTFEPKPGQRMISSWAHSPMGYALPAAVGAAFAGRSDCVICLIGDGGLQMCAGELATVARHELPVKIIVVNNDGYSIQRQTLETWLDGRMHATSVPSGLGFPSFVALGEAYGIHSRAVKGRAEVAPALREVLSLPGPELVDLHVHPDHRIVPMMKFGAGLEDLSPPLPREEIEEALAVDRPLAATDA